MFGVKDSVLRELHTCVAYKFLCAGCNTCYVDEANFPFVNGRCHLKRSMPFLRTVVAI